MLLMVLACGMMVSCGGDDDKDNDGGVSELVGTWSSSTQSGWSVKFNSDGTGTDYQLWSKKVSTSFDFTYTVNNNIIVLTITSMNNPNPYNYGGWKVGDVWRGRYSINGKQLYLEWYDDTYIKK